MQRRTFIQGSAALALTTGIEDVMEKTYRVGLIGTGWYGKCDLWRLMQVANVEVVSLCDVDSRLLTDAADKAQAKQKSGKRPQTYTDYRKMLAEKNLDIVLIATPDHWHALPMIAAVEAGADVYVQKPISVDVLEGKAMVDAARKHKRIVQVGTQRRSTPHLIEARENIIKAGKLGKVAFVETYCYYPMRARENPPDAAPPDNLDYEMWTGPAPKRPYNSLVHPGRWRSFMEYSNGIVGDMCVHMLDMVRWMLDLGWPRTISSSGGILMDKASKANITDSQTAIFDFGDVVVNWTHRTWGTSADPAYPWGATLYGDKGTLKASVFAYDFIPQQGNGEPIHKDVTYELEEYPEDKTEERLEKHVAPAIRVHMKDFLKAVEARTLPVADIEQGHISTAACILANLSEKLGRSLTFDPATHNIPGDKEATALLKRPYRSPWKHPG